MAAIILKGVETDMKKSKVNSIEETAQGLNNMLEIEVSHLKYAIKQVKKYRKRLATASFSEQLKLDKRSTQLFTRSLYLALLLEEGSY